MINNVNKYHIYEIFSAEDNFYYAIPKYQREYTWGYKEWWALYDDICENTNEYFIGSIICIPLGDTFKRYMEVIDGQQRLTTISLFLTALYNRLKSYKEHMSEDDEDILPSLRKSLKSNYSPNGLKLIPQIQNYNRDDFEEVMFINKLHSNPSTKHPYFYHRKIDSCYRYFLKLIDKEIEGKESAEAIVLLKNKLDNYNNNF